MIKIIASSDFHGRMPEITESFDLFLICGDICPVENHNIKFQDNWLHNDFVQWINSLQFKTEWSKVVMVPGNHDFAMQNYKRKDYDGIERMCNNRLVILRNEEYDFEFPVSDGIDSLRIFGTPYCSIFGRWAFMRSSEVLEEKYSQIPNGIDILLSHDAPNIWGLGDITQGYFQQFGTGNPILSKHIERVRPKLFLCGHFHSGNHELQDIDGTLMANVSYVDESYNPYWNVLSFNYNEEREEFSR